MIKNKIRPNNARYRSQIYLHQLKGYGFLQKPSSIFCSAMIHKTLEYAGTLVEIFLFFNYKREQDVFFAPLQKRFTYKT